MRSLCLPLALAMALSACELAREGDKTYAEPLVRAGVLEEEAPDEGEEAPVAAGERESDGGGSLSQTEFETYRLEDLQPGERPSLDSDEGGLWMRFDRVEESIKTSGYRLRDPELEAYVRDVTCQIAGDYCGNIRLYLINNPAFNAAMSPNGTMLIFTGALLRFQSEAELAAVVGHELGHYLRRHSLQRMRDVRGKSDFLAFFSLFAGPLAANVTRMVMVGEVFAFSRNNEREADGYGLLMMSEAGYDPTAFAEVWARLLQEFEADEDFKDRSAFFATHPSSAERQEVLAALAEKVAASMEGATVRGREAYVEMVLPRRAGFLRDLLAEGQSAQMEVLLDLLLEAEDPNPAELHYFKGEVCRLRDAEGDREAALESYRRAAASAGTAPVDLYRSLGLLLNRQGEKSEAAEALRKYLEVSPEADDRLFIEDLIGRLEAS